MQDQWTSFDENFDSSDGGALYVRTVAWGPRIPSVYQVAGVLWLDGGQDGAHYFAFVGEFEDGWTGDVTVSDMWSAADAFTHSCDGDIAHEIGWFFDIEEGVEAVNRFCGF